MGSYRISEGVFSLAAEHGVNSKDFSLALRELCCFACLEVASLQNVQYILHVYYICSTTVGKILKRAIRSYPGPVKNLFYLNNLNKSELNDSFCSRATANDSFFFEKYFNDLFFENKK